MVKLKCYHCRGDRLVRNGLTQNGKQRYLCSDCGRMSRDDPQANGYTEAERERILHAYPERSSLRGLSRTWKAYQLVIPSEQHTTAGKESGLTAHVERWN
jgi:predicted Fe-S protein YdhL (DUF1289 family)